MIPGIKQTLMAAALAVIGFGMSANAAGLRVHGSTTVVANLFEPHQSAIEAETGLSLTIVGNGSSRGLTDVSSGTADMGMISAPLDVTAAKVAKKTPGFDGSPLVGHQVGETRVAFGVHSSNPVTSLSSDQLQKILAGEITNWSEVGGASMPIAIVVEKEGGGLRTMAEKAVMGDKTISGNAKEMPNAPQVAKIVSQLPTAIGIMASALVGGGIKEVATAETISQPLILVTNGAPSADQMKLIETAKKLLR